MKRQFALRNALLSFLAAIGAVMLMAYDAQGTIVRYLEIEEMTRRSSDVFRGRVVSSESFWSADRSKIFTAIKVETTEVLKGGVATGEIVTVTQLGGEKDGRRLDYAGRPTFAAGEEVILFARRGGRGNFTIIGLKQGKLRVRGRRVERDFAGLKVVGPKGAASAPATTSDQVFLDIDEVRQRVQRTR